MTPASRIPSDSSCHGCGANDLLALARLVAQGSGDALSTASEARPLCPACLAKHLVAARQTGGRVEVLTAGGQVVEWDGADPGILTDSRQTPPSSSSSSSSS